MEADPGRQNNESVITAGIKFLRILNLREWFIIQEKRKKKEIANT